ncbi:MAG: hypothetical protein AAGA21_11945 [Pseudomonadota bacterium]
MKRRRLIKLVTLSLSVLAIPASLLPRLRADDVFNDLFGDPGFAAHIGEIHQAKERQAVTRGRKLVADLKSHPLPSMQKHLRARAEADLASMDVVVVDGWVMARAEADLCAAVYADRSLA